MVDVAEFCTCLTAPPPNGERLLLALESIRKTCPALQSVFLPDDVWTDWKAWHTQLDPVAAHCSMLLLALERGHLARLTYPVHRYLLEDKRVKPSVRLQYLHDLRERWMFYPDPLERHRKSRIFTGRVTELHIAEWLEEHGWVLTGLEALRVGPDIEATNDSCGATAFEVKSIGTEDGDFEMVLRSLAGQRAGGVVSPYAAINYLLFRVYEAAKQLAQCDGVRVAIIVIHNGNWWRFKVQWEQHWINWTSPSFFKHDAASVQFIETQGKRYPGLNTELSAVVGGLESVWILKRSSGYTYHLEDEVKPGSA
jgi:hypothetical protein